MTLVYLDCASDADAREYVPAGHGLSLALSAVRVDSKRWNGFEVPIVTGAEFRRFIAAMAANDGNGTWAWGDIREGDGSLIYEDECGTERWTVADVVDGVPVYALDGWQWVL